MERVTMREWKRFSESGKYACVWENRAGKMFCVGRVFMYVVKVCKLSVLEINEILRNPLKIIL